jgi:hypothetical protein
MSFKPRTTTSDLWITHAYGHIFTKVSNRPATRILAVGEPVATYSLGSTLKGGFILGSVCWLTCAAFSADKQSPPESKRILQRIEQIQPTAKERRFDAIGWVSGIAAAEKLSREHDRPVFLFSNVGQMELGRC